MLGNGEKSGGKEDRGGRFNENALVYIHVDIWLKFILRLCAPPSLGTQQHPILLGLALCRLS